MEDRVDHKYMIADDFFFLAPISESVFEQWLKGFMIVLSQKKHGTVQYTHEQTNMSVMLTDDTIHVKTLSFSEEPPSYQNI